MGHVDELADSSGVLHDSAVLRKRLAEAGYLFFRGLLPVGTLRAAGAAVLARLRDGGWTGADGTPSAQPRALNSVDGLSDPAFRAALMGAEFNQVPYLAPLRATVRRILGAAAFSYPVKVKTPAAFISATSAAVTNGRTKPWSLSTGHYSNWSRRRVR